MGKFVIKTATSGQPYFILKADNGEPILKGEEYSSMNACKKGIDAIKTNAPIDSRYERKTAKNYEYFFILKAANGEPICTSEMYKTEANRDKGIKSVKENAPDARVEEE